MKLQTDTPMLHLRNLLVTRGFDVEPANYSLDVSERVLNEYYKKLNVNKKLLILAISLLTIISLFVIFKL